jgi:hypothetical protein
MAHAEQKSPSAPKPSELPDEANTKPDDKADAHGKPESERMQHAAYGYKNHEDYPEGADASEAPAQHTPSDKADDAATPARRRRDPKP